MHIDGMWFKDDQGRTLILRGVNLGGSTKVPFRPNGATYVREGFYDHHNVSFVGRPFPLEEADEHFSRLRAWGFTFLRFLITWEAVEHAGPGVYDEEYLDYLYQVVRKAGEYGIDLFIDPHQDVWSRLSGGDGAPGWTFEAVGMDGPRFSETGAAIVHCIHGDPFPRMIWPTNYTKLAAATMFTLFFGGNDFAPRTMVDGEPVQEFLQRHYVNAIKQVALRLKGLSNVVGYDTLNEPSHGFIGWADLNSSGGMLRLGESPTPFQAMLLGAGFPQEVEVWGMRLTGPKLRGRRLVNPDGVHVWREGYDCVWKENGVWGLGVDGAPRLIRPDHFVQVGNRSVDFANDYLRPFANRYAREIRSVDSDTIIFVEGAPGGSPPNWRPEDAPNVVNGAHWYDGVTLFTKNFMPFLGVDFHTHKLIFGRRRVKRSFVEQLAHIKNWADERMGTIPTLIGEFGIPFDMRNKRAYRTGDFSLQTKAMDANFRAMEANLLSCTLWNYTADNDNRWGDQWNDEDLSIFSRDQQTDPGDANSGGRALEAVVRPYARKVAGEPLRMHFDLSSRTFEFEFRHDPAVRAPTEIFVPNYQYPEGYAVELSDGTYRIDREAQTLTVQHALDRETHTIRVWPAAS
ncbi:MAG: cellulase family glycosylhydrolase [Anaerolineae bacterium]